HVDSTRNRNTSRLLAGVLALPLAVGALAAAPSVAAEAAEEPLSPAVVSYDFDGDLADESGNQQDAEPRNAHDPAYAAGVNGQALLVTKGQNYVSLPVD